MDTFGLLILIVGVALWSIAHMFKCLAPTWHAALSDNVAKLIVSLLSVLTIALMIIGYSNAPMIPVYNAIIPTWMNHITMLLMVVSVWLMMIGMTKGWLHGRLVRHPMLTAVKIWACAHLLANGDAASIILFGGLLAWSVTHMILINKRDGKPVLVKGTSIGRDLVGSASAAFAYAFAVWVHAYYGLNVV